MKRKWMIFLIPLINSFYGFSGNKDTMYFDKNWKECDKGLAFYYKINEIDSSFCGFEKYYYFTGQQHSVITIKNGDKHGKATWWYKNGQKWTEGYYNYNLEDSLWIYWYPNGNKKSEKFYDDRSVKDWKGWDENGNRLYSYKRVDKIPLFNGAKSTKENIKYLTKYIHKNKKVPDIVRDRKIAGDVFVSFVVNEEGNVVNVKLVKGINHFLDEEAIRLIESLPKWQPAMSDGKNVRVIMALPINFKTKRLPTTLDY
jgi:TonB family protein